MVARLDPHPAPLEAHTASTTLVAPASLLLTKHPPQPRARQSSRFQIIPVHAQTEDGLAPSSTSKPVRRPRRVSAPQDAPFVFTFCRRCFRCRRRRRRRHRRLYRPSISSLAASLPFFSLPRSLPPGWSVHIAFEPGNSSKYLPSPPPLRLQHGASPKCYPVLRVDQTLGISTCVSCLVASSWLNQTAISRRIEPREVEGTTAPSGQKKLCLEAVPRHTIPSAGSPFTLLPKCEGQALPSSGWYGRQPRPGRL